MPVIASPRETPRYSRETPRYSRETSQYYGSSTEPRSRHRSTAKRTRHRYERQQAQAEWVNPPFGAGE
jgi:hypothetical protein